MSLEDQIWQQYQEEQKRRKCSLYPKVPEIKLNEAQAIKFFKDAYGEVTTGQLRYLQELERACRWYYNWDKMIVKYSEYAKGGRFNHASSHWDYALDRILRIIEAAKS